MRMNLVAAGEELSEEKDAIGRRAADLVDDGAVVILDGGTTTEFVARHLHVAGVTVFTNNIGAINILLRNEEVSVVVLGGRLRPMNETISGAEAEDMLGSVVADYAFIGADALHPLYGIASRTMEQSRLKTLMTQRAWQVVVVADSRKLYTEKGDFWSPFPARWLLVTDDAADPAALDRLRGTGVQVDRPKSLRALTAPASERHPAARPCATISPSSRAETRRWSDVSVPYRQPQGGWTGNEREGRLVHNDWDEFGDVLPLMP